MAACDCIGNFRYAADGSVVDMCSCGNRYCLTCGPSCSQPSEDVTCVKSQTQALELRDEELMALVEALTERMDDAEASINDHESRITTLEAP